MEIIDNLANLSKFNSINYDLVTSWLVVTAGGKTIVAVIDFKLITNRIGGRRKLDNLI